MFIYLSALPIASGIDVVTNASLAILPIVIVLVFMLVDSDNKANELKFEPNPIIQ